MHIAPTGKVWPRAATALLPLLVATSEATPQSSTLPPTLDCVEVVHAEADEALTGYKSGRQDFKVSFAVQANGEYAMIGNLGHTELMTVRGNGFVQFLEQTPLGTLNLTTILTRPEAAIYKGVHSRHTMILGELAPSQILLSCQRR